MSGLRASPITIRLTFAHSVTRVELANTSHEQIGTDGIDAKTEML